MRTVASSGATLRIIHLSRSVASLSPTSGSNFNSVCSVRLSTTPLLFIAPIYLIIPASNIMPFQVTNENKYPLNSSSLNSILIIYLENYHLVIDKVFSKPVKSVEFKPHSFHFLSLNCNSVIFSRLDNGKDCFYIGVIRGSFMKLLHVSDTHLGYSEYTKIDPVTGLNQREQDVYNAWKQVIDAVFMHHPDVVIHAGDLFHTPRPSNRAIRIALEGIQKISSAGIPLVLISGNHETPRIRATGSIFESLALFPHVYAAFSSRLETFSIEDVTFFALPHCSLTEELEKAIEELKSAKQKNAGPHVLVSHGAWSGKASYSMGEFNEQRLPDFEKITGSPFAYVALGHYHRHVQIRSNIAYSSSTERTSFNEYNAPCGYLTVDLDSHQSVYHEIESRPMIKAPTIDCTDLTVQNIYDRLQEFQKSVTDGAMVQVSLSEIDTETFLRLESRVIDEIFPNVLILEKQFYRKCDPGKTAFASAAIEALPVEFERFIEGLDDAQIDKKRLREMGTQYL
ncbi:MAG: exonuclease SbcCD subunit D, partial [Calditrichaeota bacterium]